MSRGPAALRIAQIVITAVAGLLVVPVAVNIGTGGQAPGWLQPVVGWLWPVALICVAVVVLLEILGQRRDSAGISPRRPQDPRNVDRALDQVQRYVEGRQRGSLTGRLRIALDLDERPESVRQPAHLVQRVSGTEFQLAAESDVADVFATMDESMLVLGAPGAGKTTQLLDLAAALVARARTAAPGDTPPIPVVVDLAEWSRSGVRRLAGLGSRDRGPVDFARWLLRTLEQRYCIPESVGRAWLAQDRLIILLDGLDEVRDADREKCVRAINDLQERQGTTRLAVCCRVADYGRFTERLALQGAVEIRPSTRHQVEEFLRSVDARLAGVADLLAADEELWELLATPLMLTIMVIAEEGRTVTALADGVDAAGRRRLLFDAYVTEALARRRRGDRGDPERALRALRMLASASATDEQGVRVVPLDFRIADRVSVRVREVGRLCLLPATVFLVTVIPLAVMCLLVSTSAARVAVVFGVVLLAMFEPEGEPSAASFVRAWPLVRHVLVVFLVVGAAVVGAVCLVGRAGEPRAQPVAVAAVAFAGTVTAWTWVSEGRSYPALAAWFVGLGIIPGAGVLFLGVPGAALGGWAVGLVYGTCATIAIVVDDLKARAARDAPQAPRGHRRLFWWSALALLVAPWFVDGSGGGSFAATTAGYVVGVSYGFGLSLVIGSPLSTVYLRSALAVAGEGNPWRRSFLRFAADRTLLTLVDGEYRFVHLLVRDHLAACDPGPLAEAVLRRRAELARR